MRRLLVFVFFGLMLSSFVLTEHGRWSVDTDIILEHKFGAGGTWTERGSLSYRSLANTPLSTSRLLEEVFITQKPLNEVQKQELKNLVLKDELYSIRVTLEEKRQTRTIMASTKACALVESNLQDHITLHFDQFQTLIGLQYNTKTSKCTLLPHLGISDDQISLQSQKFNSTAELRYALEGGLPKEVTKEIPEETKKEGEETKPEDQGFFAKYWMYLLIGLLFMNIVPKLLGVEEDSASSGQQRAGTPAPRRRT